MKNLEEKYKVISDSIFNTDAPLDYSELHQEIIGLLDLINDVYDDSTETLWCIGEFEACSLFDFIVGAYWHYTEWHGGQSSETYAALCALGSIYSPGMTTIESEEGAARECYELMNELADDERNQCQE